MTDNTKPTLIITNGSPRTGKSTWGKEFAAKAENNAKHTGDFSAAIALLRAGKNVVLDAEALTGFNVRVEEFPHKPVDDDDAINSISLSDEDLAKLDATTAALEENAALKEQLAQLQSQTNEIISENAPVPVLVEQADNRNTNSETIETVKAAVKGDRTAQAKIAGARK